MKPSRQPFVPDWRESPPREGTYRSIFKWGAPDAFKHPSDTWYEMFKQEFGLGDADADVDRDQKHDEDRDREPDPVTLGVFDQQLVSSTPDLLVHEPPPTSPLNQAPKVSIKLNGASGSVN